MLLAAAAMLLLAACEREAAAPTSLSEEEVAAQLAKVKVDPGQWESTTQIVSAKGDLPQEALREMTGRRTSGGTGGSASTAGGRGGY